MPCLRGDFCLRLCRRSSLTSPGVAAGTTEPGHIPIGMWQDSGLALATQHLSLTDISLLPQATKPPSPAPHICSCSRLRQLALQSRVPGCMECTALQYTSFFANVKSLSSCRGHGTGLPHDSKDQSRSRHLGSSAGVLQHALPAQSYVSAAHAFRRCETKITACGAAAVARRGLAEAPLSVTYV